MKKSQAPSLTPSLAAICSRSVRARRGGQGGRSRHLPGLEPGDADGAKVAGGFLTIENKGAARTG